MKDAKFFSGWVNHFDGREVRIRLSQPGGCDPGDQFLVEIFGSDLDVIFQAAVSMAFDNQIYLNVFGQITMRHASEKARLSVNGIFGVITTEEGDVEVRAVDISVGGIGLLCKKPLKKKAVVKLKLCTPAGEIVGEGEVRYCRVDPSGNGSYRAGIMLSELGRLEKARWQRLYEREAA